ncbi:MAG: DNA repair protein RecN [Desulfobulbaceae bacterium]|nr:DNA repair protein RecN [Desulfobulbaceae bacterium]
MLHELRIQSLALIDTLHLDFSARDAGLIVLTGETGAGKSIILQAVNLLTGGRGSSTWVRSDSEQAAIEAVFTMDATNSTLHTLLEEQGLDDTASSGQCIFRRILYKDGRSRLFINDQAVTAKLAAELSTHLVNIASQHDQQQLLNARSHLDFLDSYGELWNMRQHVADQYQQWRQAANALQELRQREADKEQQHDFLRFQLEEIGKIKPQTGEDEALIRERDQLKASVALVHNVGAAARQLSEAQDNLTEAKKSLEQAAALDAALLPLAERTASAGFELEDISDLAARYLADLPTDTSRLELIAGRLADLKLLQRKYGPTLAEVLAFAEKAAQELADLESMEEQIQCQEKETAALLQVLEQSAGRLSRARSEAARKMVAQMESELASLSFTQAKFVVSLQGSREDHRVRASGWDEVEFLFSANPGEPPKALSRIASGGELSRLLLAMKCLLARRDQVDTVIFDEVDAGIGGQAAEAVAGKISELAGHHQVICITHLPQIAARADLHFKVEKQVAQGRTSTEISLLDEEQRLAELARMLDGEQASAQTHAYVRELVARKLRSVP